MARWNSGKKFEHYAENDIASASDLNNVRERVERLENVDAKAPLSVHQGPRGLTFGLNQPITDMFWLKAKQDLIPTGWDSFADANAIEWDSGNNEYITRAGLFYPVYNMFKQPFFMDDYILVGRESERRQLVYIPTIEQVFTGTLLENIGPRESGMVQRMLGEQDVSCDYTKLGGTYIVCNIHDWKLEEGDIVRCSWDHTLCRFVITSADCNPCESESESSLSSSISGGDCQSCPNDASLTATMQGIANKFTCTICGDLNASFECDFFGTILIGDGSTCCVYKHFSDFFCGSPPATYNQIVIVVCGFGNDDIRSIQINISNGSGSLSFRRDFAPDTKSGCTTTSMTPTTNGDFWCDISGALASVS